MKPNQKPMISILLNEEEERNTSATYFLNSKSGRLAYCPNSANRLRFISKSNCAAPPVENFVFIIMLSMKKSSNWWEINLNAMLKILIESSVSRLCKLVTISWSFWYSTRTIYICMNTYFRFGGDGVWCGLCAICCCMQRDREVEAAAAQVQYTYVGWRS